MRSGRFAAISPWRRPTEFVEGTRWLFAALALTSLALTLILVLTSVSAVNGTIALISAGVLAWSCTSTYAHRSAVWYVDVTDTLATLAIALAGPGPGTVVGFVCVVQWFRCLYSSTWSAALRVVVYISTLGLAVLIWPHLPGNAGLAMFGPEIGIVPTSIVAILVLVGPSLAASLKDRERSALLDAVHTSVGSQLLGDTNEVDIRRIAEKATAKICAAIPELRVLSVMPSGTSVVVNGAKGAFVAFPGTLPEGVLTLPGGDRGTAAESEVAQNALDAATGTECAWVLVPLPHLPDEPDRGRLLLGAPRSVPADALVAVSGLMNQVTLALRNNEAQRRLTALATLDGLTGLANRMTFNTAVAAALTEESDPKAAVLFVDLDDFKEVNDQLGHGAGDDLLRAIALRLCQVTRAPDLCARIGGDEFAVLLRGTRGGAAVEVARRIVLAVALPVPLGAGVAVVGASVGIATATNETDFEQLIHHADVAMYAAKNSGKARIQIFHPDLLGPRSPECS